MQLRSLPRASTALAERPRPSDELLGVARAGAIDRDGGAPIEVFKLTLAPRREYIVPQTKLP